MVLSPNNQGTTRPKETTSPSVNPKKGGRRGAKRKAATKKESDAPMFLRKAFFIINTCDPQIASWSDDGLTFWVKDPDRFATEVIPQCFKHNHFSSFVRQLNFYGFRKLRDEDVELRNTDVEKAKWCHFHHPKFQRGRPDLLVEITKNTHKDVAEKTELEALRREVKDLKSQIKNLKVDMGILTSLVEDWSKQTQTDNDNSLSQPLSKKQKLSPTPFTATPMIPAPVAPQKLKSRELSNVSNVSMSSEDEEFLNSLFAEEGGFDNLSPDSLPDTVLSGF